MYTYFINIFGLFILLSSCSQTNNDKQSDNETADDFSYKKSYSIYDLTSKEEAYLLYQNNFPQQQIVKLYLSSDSRIVDSIIYDGLLLEPNIYKRDSFFLEVTLPLKAGLGHFLEKTILLSVDGEKLSEALNIITKDELTVNKDIEDYNVEFTINGYNASLKEYFTKKKENILIDSFFMESMLNYSDKEKIFTNRKIENDQPVVVLRHYEYELIDGKWYANQK